MKKHTVTLIPGEGIGPEVTDAMRRVLDDATGLNIDWWRCLAGQVALDEGYSEELPEDTIQSIKNSDAAIKGPIGTPKGAGFPSVNVELRKRLDLYANVRPVKSFAGVNCLYPDVDLVLVRENTEDFYAAEEYEADVSNTGVIAEAKITDYGSHRIFMYGFKLARQLGKTKLAGVHKANILKMFYGRFLKQGQEIAKIFPEIEFRDVIVDNMGMQLVMNPQQFEVIVAPNMFGDILSDVCAGLVGGLGFAPGANIGDNNALFEAVHGTAPDIAGQDKANPTALILSGAMMLDYLGEDEAAAKVRMGVAKVLAEGKYVTGDINKTNPVGTRAMADAIIAAMNE